jgi:hypothetical protein
MSDTFFSRTSFRVAPFPSFLGGRVGIALRLLRRFVGTAFLFQGLGKINLLFSRGVTRPSGSGPLTPATTLRSRAGFLTAALLICFAGSGGSLFALTEAAEESRAAEIIAARKAKIGRLAPEVNSSLE